VLQRKERHDDKQAREGNKAETGQQKEGDDQMVYFLILVAMRRQRGGNYVIRPPVSGSKSRRTQSALEFRTPASAQTSPTNQVAA
jgi:hypothetical protein